MTRIFVNATGAVCMDGSSSQNRHRTSNPGLYSSQQSSINPLMHNWNTVYVNYCDGTSFAGDSQQIFQNKTLRFRGKNSRDGVIRTLLKLNIAAAEYSTQNATTLVKAHSLAHATEVVITGISAGGLAVLLGIDNMAETIRRTAITQGNGNIFIRGFIDSGFFLEYSSSCLVELNPKAALAITQHTIQINGNKTLDYAKAMRDVFVFGNISAGANKACLQAHAGQPPRFGFPAESDCIFAASLIPHIKTPLFFVQSRFDSYQIMQVYDSMFTAAGANDFGQDLQRQLHHALFEASGMGGHGAFVDGCAHHGPFSCRGISENFWSGKNVRSTNAVDLVTLQKHGLSEEGSGGIHSTQWNPAQAFERWYKHSLREARVTTAVPGLNWFVQGGDFPCYGCCACSPELRGNQTFASLNKYFGS